MDGRARRKVHVGLAVNVLQFSLNGAAQAEQAAAANIANDQTPGYQEQTVSFQASLEAALSSGTPSTAEVTTGVSDAPEGSDGNNVDLTSQMVDVQRDQLQTQADVEALNLHFAILSGSMGNAFSS
jgi:flagellar basal body rod protein FlgB